MEWLIGLVVLQMMLNNGISVVNVFGVIPTYKA